MLAYYDSTPCPSEADAATDAPAQGAGPPLGPFSLDGHRWLAAEDPFAPDGSDGDQSRDDHAADGDPAAWPLTPPCPPDAPHEASWARSPSPGRGLWALRSPPGGGNHPGRGRCWRPASGPAPRMPRIPSPSPRSPALAAGLGSHMDPWRTYSFSPRAPRSCAAGSSGTTAKAAASPADAARIPRPLRRRRCNDCGEEPDLRISSIAMTQMCRVLCQVPRRPSGAG